MDGQQLQDLRDFVTRADRLGNSRLFHSGLRTGLQIEFDQTKGITYTSTVPPEEDLAAMLVVLRPFTLQKDRLSIGRVINTCRRNLDDAQLQQALETLRASWKQAQREGGIKLKINDEEWSPEAIADLMINGYFFHTDVDKARLLDSLMPELSVWVQHGFLFFVLDVVRVVMLLRNVVDKALAERLFRS